MPRPGSLTTRALVTWITSPMGEPPGWDEGTITGGNAGYHPRDSRGNGGFPGSEHHDEGAGHGEEGARAQARGDVLGLAEEEPADHEGDEGLGRDDGGDVHRQGVLEGVVVGGDGGGLEDRGGEQPGPGPAGDGGEAR